MGAVCAAWTAAALARERRRKSRILALAGIVELCGFFFSPYNLAWRAMQLAGWRGLSCLA